MPNPSASTSSSALPPPRASINVLPLELKQYIAQLCADDDDDSCKRNMTLRAQLRNCDNHEHEYDELDEPIDDDDWHKMDDAVENFIGGASCRRVIPQLFQVSREWADIVAPHRFKTVEYRQLPVAPLVYRVPGRLAPPSSVQLAHFRNHDLRRVDPLVVDYAISIIRPVARRLVLDAGAVDRLVEVIEDEAVRNKLAVIEEVEVDYPPASTSTLLGALPRLQSISLFVKRQELTEGLVRDIIKAAPSVRQLSIREPRGFSVEAQPAASSLRWEPLRALESFLYDGQDLGPVVLGLVAACAPTLRSLDLRLSSSTAQPALATRVAFPRLAHLALSGQCSGLAPLLESLSENAIPNLVELKLGNRWELFQDPTAEREYGEPLDEEISSPLLHLDALLLPSGRPHRTLATIFLSDPERFFRADELDYLEGVIAEHYSTYEWILAPMRRFPSRAVFPDAVEHAGTSATSAERVRRDLRRTLDHVDALYERASLSARMSSDDKRRVARLAEALSEFEFDRVERGL
ncbi:hypothetical protein JCM3775_005510 [Rhodotorula graminis]